MPTLLAAIRIDHNEPVATQLEGAKKIVEQKLASAGFGATEVQIVERLHALFLYHSNPFLVDRVIQIITKENDLIREVTKDEPRFGERPVEEDPSEITDIL